jgi:hypothetical protein
MFRVLRAQSDPNAAIREMQAEMEMPGLNHLFQTCKTCTIPEYGDLEETFAPAALEAMGDWIAAH